MPEEKIVSNYATYLTIIPIILGILGFFISLYNTYVAHIRNKVNLKVSATLKIVNAIGVTAITKEMLSKFPAEEREEILNKKDIVIDITNLSDFPVFIDEIGFTKDKKFSSGCSQIVYPIFGRGAQNLNQKTMETLLTPFELRSRDTIMLLTKTNANRKLEEQGHKKAYVKTACGTCSFADKDYY